MPNAELEVRIAGVASLAEPQRRVLHHFARLVSSEGNERVGVVSQPGARRE